jgi:dihydrofolate synthase/folylpolyglutamate synthase
MTTEQWSLASWLTYLENRHREPIQLGLDRVHHVARALDVLQWDIPVIIVTGTNGKGSTVAALEAIYCAAGYRVAAYTSPHLLRFNERIRVNAELISDAQLCALFQTVTALPDSAALTYFEVTTLVALLYFRQMQPEVMILEVGLGGRLDATNIIDADVAIITTVDLDHQAWLGETREAIGMEKAGVLRQQQQLVYADPAPPDSVRAIAKACDVRWLGLGTDYFYTELATDWVIQLPSGQTVTLPKPKIHLNSAAAAVLATACLQAVLPVTAMHWAAAFTALGVPGRQQCIPAEVYTLLDVAHNPQAVRQLAVFLKQQAISGQIHAVFAALKDKDIAGLITPLQSMVSHWYAADLSGPRAMPVEELACGLMQNGVSSDIISKSSDPKTAYFVAMQRALPGDWLVVYGSFLTVAPVLAIYSKGEG